MMIRMITARLDYAAQLIRDCDVCAFRKVYVNEWSAVGYLEGWAERGWRGALGCLDAHLKLHRVALMSRSPCKQMQLPGVTRSSRCVAVLLESCTDTGYGKIKVAMQARLRQPNFICRNLCGAARE